MKLKRKLYFSIIHPIKYCYQRLIRGFDDSDLWDLDKTIVQFILPRIKEFQMKHQDNCLDNDWKENLNIIVKTFELLNQKQLFERSETENEFIKNGLRLFADNLETLWN